MQARGVFFEAMAAGLPVVCFDYAGPGEMVTDECGIKIKAINPDKALHDLADALEVLANDIDLRKRLSEGARTRILDFDWDKKGEVIKTMYENMLKEKCKNKV